MLMISRTQPSFTLAIQAKAPLEFHQHPLTFFIWKYAEKGIKEKSKAYYILHLLLHFTNKEVLLTRNSQGKSIYEYLLRKHAESSKSKSKDRGVLIEEVRSQVEMIMLQKLDLYLRRMSMSAFQIHNVLEFC